MLGEKERVRGIRELLRLHVLRLSCIPGAVRELQQLDILSSLKRDIPFLFLEKGGMNMSRGVEPTDYHGGEDHIVENRDTAHEDHGKHISPNDIGVDTTNVGSKDRKIKRTSD